MIWILSTSFFDFGGFGHPNKLCLKDETEKKYKVQLEFFSDKTIRKMYIKPT